MFLKHPILRRFDGTWGIDCGFPDPTPSPAFSNSEGGKSGHTVFRATANRPEAPPSRSGSSRQCPSVVEAASFLDDWSNDVCKFCIVLEHTLAWPYRVDVARKKTWPSRLNILYFEYQIRDRTNRYCTAPERVDSPYCIPDMSTLYLYYHLPPHASAH